jgi:hypothetical protein
MNAKLAHGIVTLEKSISDLEERLVSRETDESDRSEIDFRIHHLKKVEKILLTLNIEIERNPSLRDSLDLSSNEQTFRGVEGIIFIRR